MKQNLDRPGDVWCFLGGLLILFVVVTIITAFTAIVWY